MVGTSAPGSPTDKYPDIRDPVSGIGNSFSVFVPLYTVTNIVIPAKP
jgi:hypothetical protein